MKNIKAVLLPQLNTQSSLYWITEQLDKQSRNEIALQPWPHFPSKPSVSFAIAYGSDCLAVKYYVSEQQVKAVYSHINEPVYQDSCVELFIAFDETAYYNFEFNCIGTCLAGFGADRHNRKLLPEDIIGKIQSLTIINKRNSAEQQNTNWALTILFPLDVFCHHQLHLLQGKTVRGNFYKCGDDLEQPHYLCWNNIEAPKPDFHLPQFFGTIQFQ